MTLDLQAFNKVQSHGTTVGARELDDLVRRMSGDAETADELDATVLYFLSLGSGDLEAVLSALRALAVNDAVIPEAERAFLRDRTPILDALARQLNEASMKENGIPFHLALAKGLGAPLEKVVAASQLDADRPFGDRVAAGDATRGGCPDGNYPRYVPHNSPWKLRVSFNITIRQRPQDVGCHYDHGPFQGTIRGWVTFSPQTAAMVSLQGWGYNLAANNNHLFYKWWFVAMMGMTPFTCMNTLYIRRF